MTVPGFASDSRSTRPSRRPVRRRARPLLRAHSHAPVSGRALAQHDDPGTPGDSSAGRARRQQPGPGRPVTALASPLARRRAPRRRRAEAGLAGETPSGARIRGSLNSARPACRAAALRPLPAATEVWSRARRGSVRATRRAGTIGAAHAPFLAASSETPESRIPSRSGGGPQTCGKRGERAALSFTRGSNSVGILISAFTVTRRDVTRRFALNRLGHPPPAMVEKEPVDHTRGVPNPVQDSFFGVRILHDV